MVVPAVIAGAGSLIAGGLNWAGESSSNRANRKMAREQMAFQERSAREAMGFSQASSREQMAFQERMSNTSYQRAVQDMQAAGINPILAYNQGGASAPSGSSARGEAQSGANIPQRNVLSNAVSSALDAKRIQAQIEQTRVLTEIAKAELSSASLDKKINESWAGMGLKILERIMPTVNTGASIFNRVFKK